MRNFIDKEANVPAFATITAALLPIALAASAVCAQEQLWVKQFGGALGDSITAMAPDGQGGITAIGKTSNILAVPGTGGWDPFVTRYDADGQRLWLVQLGSAASDFGRGITADGAGGTFITGNTEGNMSGASAGGSDFFLARLDGDGKEVWLKQFGTGFGDGGESVLSDGQGGVFIGGTTRGIMGAANLGDRDVIIARFDSVGDQIWMKQLGSDASDGSPRLARDGAGGVYLSGSTTGSVGGPNLGSFDFFLSRIDSDGNVLWQRQYGTAGPELCLGVTSDGNGGVLLSGYTNGILGGQAYGKGDGFLMRVSNAGDQLWVTQYGSNLDDKPQNAVINSNGQIVVTGFTEGSLGGPTAGNTDAFLAGFSTDGEQRWVTQYGTSESDFANGIASDGVGGVFVGGQTKGALTGTNAGGDDAFIARYDAPTCYADCDSSTGAGNLDIFDFLCFQDNFINGETYACDCTTSTGVGVCDIFDFLCFQTLFVGGCP